MKRIALFFVAIALVFTLTACGGGGLSGTYVVEWQYRGDTYTNTYKFSGKSYTREGPIALGLTGRPSAHMSEQGTYSIVDDKIEFVKSDGEVKVSSFSRTDNTIRIGETRYVKR
jgi:hypothetical protein